MPTEIKSKRGLTNMHSKCSEDVQAYFEHLPALLESFSLDVCLAYVFLRLELGQNMAIYCGLAKLHRVKTDLAGEVVQRQHITRAKFVELYSTVFDLKLPKDAHEDLKSAEKIRDNIMHGKKTNDNLKRNAIARVLEFAEEVNSQLDCAYSLRPYGSLKGFAGKAEKLDDRISRFMLKGMGFNIS